MKMNKEEIWNILECCLLASDDVSFEKLRHYGFNSAIAEAGINLLNFLKSKEINERRLKNEI